MNGELSAMSMDEAVEGLMRIHKSLPARPRLEEFATAKSLIQNVQREDELRLEVIAKQSKGENVPEELFIILQEMQRNMIHFRSKKQKEEALKLLDLEALHLLFDGLVQRASECLQSHSQRSKSTTSSSLEACSTKDDSCLKKSKMSISVDDIGVEPRVLDPTLKPAVTTTFSHDDGKLSFIKLASHIELSAKKGSSELILQGKLSDKTECLPNSIGKLSSLIKLDLSENRLAVLPDAIGRLSSLQTLDLHANKLQELPESTANLLNLLHLNLRGNQLTSLPPIISRLVRLQELDLSSNRLSVLPETVGLLVGLRQLNVETNDLEEIPHTIGRCTCLKELHADYNRLKALPEAVGRIESLEILTVRYNNIKQLPTTMSSLSSLRQLDVSFNELESIPESLCLATTLVKIDVSNNFADLQALPRSIGNLEMLEELLLNNNQIRALPDSFGMLTRLRVLNLEGNPLVVPPSDVVEKGALAVVHYMSDLVARRDVKQNKSWAIRFFSKSNKLKRNHAS